MSIQELSDGIWKVRWRDGCRHRNFRGRGSRELAQKIERKKMSVRDENRHLDVQREVNFRMSTLINRCTIEYANRKRSIDRKKSIFKPHSPRAGRLLRSRSGWPGDPAMVSRTHRKWTLHWYGREALQRHASHDEEGRYDLVAGNRYRLECRGNAGGDARRMLLYPDKHKLAEGITAEQLAKMQTGWGFTRNSRAWKSRTEVSRSIW